MEIHMKAIIKTAKSHCLLFMLTTALCVPFKAIAAGDNGGGSTGGGKAVCVQNKPKKYRVLDLWEAENTWGLKIQDSNAPVAEQVNTALKRLDKILDTTSFTSGTEAGIYSLSSGLVYEAECFIKSIDGGDTSHCTSNMKYVWKKGGTIILTDDSYEDILPNKCEKPIEQIVKWVDGEQIVYVNQDLFDRLSPTDKAALITHEVLYAYLRRFYLETDSLRVRKVVGQVFSGKTFKYFTELLPKQYEICQSSMDDDKTIVYIYPGAPEQNDQGVNLYSFATYLFGRPSLGISSGRPQSTINIGGLDKISFTSVFESKSDFWVAVDLQKGDIISKENDIDTLTDQISYKREKDVLTITTNSTTKYGGHRSTRHAVLRCFSESKQTNY